MAKDTMVETSTDDSRAKNPISNNQTNIPATKQFVVNATGNLFIATTLSSPDTPENISEEAKEAFAQVSVFFAALTKAMSDSGKSLYDYDALNDLIMGSGLFVNVTKSTINFESSSWGVTFSNQLIQALLGLSGNLAALSHSLRSLIASVGSEGLKVAKNRVTSNKKVGTIIFVCEYLMGAVSITPLVFSIDASLSEGDLKLGPCFDANNQKKIFHIEKEVHLFVPPNFIRQASELNEAMSDPEFNNLVESMKRSIEGTDGSPGTSSPADNSKG